MIEISMPASAATDVRINDDGSILIEQTRDGETQHVFLTPDQAETLLSTLEDSIGGRVYP